MTDERKQYDSVMEMVEDISSDSPEFVQQVRNQITETKIADLRRRVEFIEKWMRAYEAAVWMPPVDSRITGSEPRND